MKSQNESYPVTGYARAKDNAKFLTISVSGFWRYVQQGRIKRPIKLTPRVSVWPVEYIRGLADGLPEPGTEHPDTTKAGVSK